MPRYARRARGPFAQPGQRRAEGISPPPDDEHPPQDVRHRGAVGHVRLRCDGGPPVYEEAFPLRGAPAKEMQRCELL